MELMINKLIRKIRNKIKRELIFGQWRMACFIDRLYFKDYDSVSTTMRKINFCSIIWNGQVNYIDLFFTYTVPSLLQPGNILALSQIGYRMELTIYTRTQKDVEVINSYRDQLDGIKKYMTIKIVPIEWTQDFNTNDILTEALIQHFEKCHGEDAWYFNVPGNKIFGNHSIANAMKLVEGKDICLACAYARVNKSSVDTSEKLQRLQSMQDTVENDELVDLTLQSSHASLLNTFDHCDENRDLSIKAVSDQTYAVVMNIPDVFLISVKRDDINFFKRTGRYDNLDKSWARLLVRQNRIKLVGSSDLYFSIKLTDKGQIPLASEASSRREHNIGSKERLGHQYVCNTFYSIWRGREKGRTLLDNARDQRSGVAIDA